MSKVSIAVLATTAALFTGRAVAQDGLQCTFFAKPNLIMVGGHEDNTPVIPVVLNYITLDLILDRSCHVLTFGIATQEGADEKNSRKLICFKMSSHDSQKIEATFQDIPGNGKLAGVTKPVATISSDEDRAAAIDLAEKCQMQAKRPQGDGADGLDIKYMRMSPTFIQPAPAA